MSTALPHTVTIDTVNVPEKLYALDVTTDMLYVATDLGALMSDDYGDHYAYSFYWGWDPTRDIDLQGDSGWLVVSSWGSKSGPSNKSSGSAWQLQRGDLLPGHFSMTWVVIDPTDPENVAFAGSGSAWKYRTLDGGIHWTSIQNQVIYAAVVDSVPVIFANNVYSEDRGDTWQSLGITARKIVYHPDTGLFYTAQNGGGIYFGVPGTWTLAGLGTEEIVSLDICGGYLIAVSVDGDIFRNALADIQKTHVFLPLVVKNKLPQLSEGTTFYLGQRSSSLCAEHNSYVVPVATASDSHTLTEGTENTVQYRIQAAHPFTKTHPTNAPSSAWCDADWLNCPENSQDTGTTEICQSPFQIDETITKVYDDCNSQEQIYVLDGAADIGTFWVRVNGTDHGQHTGVVLGSRWGNADSWNHDGVIYANGFTRWKPKGKEPGEESDPCFGTSVILGPFQMAEPFLGDGYSPNPLRHPKIESVAISVCPHLNIQMSGAYYEGDQRVMEASWYMERNNINPSEMLVSVSQQYTTTQDVLLYPVLLQYGIGQVGMSSMYADPEKHDADTQIGPGGEVWVGEISSVNQGLWGQENQLHPLPVGQYMCLETKTPTNHNTGSPTMCVYWDQVRILTNSRWSFTKNVKRPCFDHQTSIIQPPNIHKESILLYG